MNIYDRFNLVKKIFLKNKRDWLQVILTSISIVFVLAALTAYYSYQRFGKIMMESGLNAHKLNIYGLHESNKEDIDKILNLKEIVALKKEYEVYERARVNGVMLELYSVPEYVDYFSSINNIKEGTIVVSKNLKLKINNKLMTGKKLIGQKVAISLNDKVIVELEIVDIIDTSVYGISNDSAFLSLNDMLKIGDFQKKLMDENSSLDGIYVAFINDSSLINKAYDDISNLGYVASYMVSADTNAINTIYNNIFLVFYISIFIFLGIKLFYLNSYFNKEKKQIFNYISCSYPIKEIYKIYKFKNFISSILAIIFSFILYNIGKLGYNIIKKDLVAFGLKAVLPWYFYLLIWGLEIFLTFFITKFYFKKPKKALVN